MKTSHAKRRRVFAASLVALALLSACSGPLEVPPTPTPNPSAVASTNNHDHGGGGSDVRLITRYGGPVKVSLETRPAQVEPGAPFTVLYRLLNAKGQPVTAEGLRVTHEKLMHLIVVSQDLGSFQHVHPENAGEAPGEYRTQVTLPSAGNYILYNEFVTAQGVTQIERHVLPAGGQGVDTPAQLSPTLGTVEESNGLRATMTANAPRIRRRLPVGFTLDITKLDGTPALDLQPWLGAPCHIVIVSADTKQFAHTHGDIPGGAMAGDMSKAGMNSMAMPTPPARFGPRLMFTHTFMQPGPYRIWLQTQHAGGVATFGFNLLVEK